MSTSEKKDTQSMRWMITINNYTNEECDFILNLDKELYKTICFYKEEGEKEHTPHLQGYINLKRSRRFSYIKKIFPRAHIEQCKGTHQECLDYCRKQHKPLIDYDICNKKGERNEIKDFIDEVKSNKSNIKELIETHTNVFTRYNKAFNQAIDVFSVNKYEFNKKTVIWLYGKTGTGKTRYAHQYLKDKNIQYSVINDFKWIGNQFNEFDEAMIFDDLRAQDVKFNYLLKLLDGYSMKVEIKGGFKTFNPKIIFITSSMEPHFMYSENVNNKNDNINQLLRRITEIREIKDENEEIEDLKIEEVYLD